MLAVAVHLDGDVEAVLEGVAVAGLHGPADPQVERQADHVCIAVGGNSGGTVGRAVVHDRDLEAGIELP